jgi:hypothetical protein
MDPVMSSDSSFTVFTDGEKSSDTTEPDCILGLKLLKEFLPLNRTDKLKVIQFVSRLASSPRRDDA